MLRYAGLARIRAPRRRGRNLRAGRDAVGARAGRAGRRGASSGDGELRELLVTAVDDPSGHAAVTAERNLLAALRGGCSALTEGRIRRPHAGNRHRAPAGRGL